MCIRDRCKSGQIQNCCHPNAIITLKEFLQDYASDATRAVGETMICLLYTSRCV